MGVNKAFDRDFFLIEGAVKTSGSSLTLAKGAVAALDQSKTTANGVSIIADFAGKPKTKKDFVLRQGIEGKTPGRSYSNKDYSTIPFSLNEVVELSVSAPQITEHIVDEVVIGYDGTPGTEFDFNKGDAYFRIALSLKGGAIEWKGGAGAEELVAISVEIPDCDPFDNCDSPACTSCDAADTQAIVLEAVERLKRKQVTGGKTVADFIDITPVQECDNAVTATLIPYDFYEVSICDTGDDSAKAIVASQYDVPVRRTARVGSISTYEMLLIRTAGAPADLETTIGSIIKGCATCPADYTAVSGGFVYAFTIEDDGSDQSALITAMTNYATGTVVKSGNSAGVGFYTAVFTAKISDAQIATLVGTAGARATSTVDLIGKVADICTPDTPTSTTAWTLGDTVNAVSDAYEIWIPDTECGTTRLEELAGNYSDLTLAIAQSRTLTLTGTSGTANVSVGGTNYLATFATSLTQTAANFVTTHAATILAAKGVIVTASGAILTFKNVGVALPTISRANASGDLTGTLAAAANITGGCQTKYVTKTISNLVGDECATIYKDAYITSAPSAFDNIDWALVNTLLTSPNGHCKMGIRFKSKVFILDGDEALRDTVGFLETSTQIQVAAGFPDEIREGIGSIPVGGYQGKYLSRQQHRTHLAGNLRVKEAESKAYFRNQTNDKGYLGRLLRGETSNMQDSLVQYIQYKLKISSFKHSQSFAGRINEDINYNFFVEVGKHNALEDLLNNLAANAGVEPVKAFGV